MAPTFTDVLVELAANPKRPVLLIDERRFGPDEGFSDSRIVFAGVITTVEIILAFGLLVEATRDKYLDAQKRLRGLNAGDVLHGRMAQSLRTAASVALQNSTVTFWATSVRYLKKELAMREEPAALLIDGGAVNGAETPVIEMMSGEAADWLWRNAPAEADRRLDVVVDRSSQNGLNLERTHEEFTVYDVDGPAHATKENRPIVLGLGIRRRIFAVSERTPTAGDWVLLPDLAAHLWAYEPKAVAYLHDEIFLRGIQKINDMPGTAIVAEFQKIEI